MIDKTRRMIPSAITFASLIIAFSAIVLAIRGEFLLAGSLIVVDSLLDGLDGALARRLRVTSSFGLQLDSLVDTVAFGVAPSVLTYQYLSALNVSPSLSWLVCTGYLVGGVFRLARFNLLPEKSTYGETVGLTITTSGATLTLSILSNHAYGDQLVPAFVFPLVAATLTLLMVSRIRYPALASIFRRRWFSMAALVTAALLSFWLTPQVVWFCVNGSYVSFGLARAAYDIIR